VFILWLFYVMIVNDIHFFLIILKGENEEFFFLIKKE